MPVHDWTRVAVDIFHDFHLALITYFLNAFNDGLLPPDYYAIGEQHDNRLVTDILTLHTSQSDGELPPKVSRELTATETYRQRRRTLTIRHVSGHRLVAMVEIVSPANKDRVESVEALVAKTVEALELGVHVMIIDLLPPGRHDPRGLHGAVWNQFDEGPYDFALAEPLTIASYSSGPPVKAYLEHLAVGGAIPDMPLFLRSDRYIPAPLEKTYEAAYRGVPAFWKEVIEGRRTADD